MTVLLVDDQISILSGLISGIDWDTLGITTIRTAISAAAAKEILLNEPVDLVLCDIEMPGGNGLSLLRWARMQKLDFVCIFLTSHADFLYAKEAIQLDCFDYILQPARYEDIQATITRAITQVHLSSHKKELEQYGAIARNRIPLLTQNLFIDWIAGQELSIPSLLHDIKLLGIASKEKDPVFVLYAHLIKWKTDPWPMQEWNFFLNNMVTEVYANAECSILPFSIDIHSFGWLIWSPEKEHLSQTIIEKPIQTVYEILAEHFPCNVAFYMTSQCTLGTLNQYAGVLLRLRQNNLLSRTGIFSTDNQKKVLTKQILFDVTQLQRIESLLIEHKGDIAYSEIDQFLNSMQTEKMVLSDLHNLWIQFQHITLNVLQLQAYRIADYFPILEQGQHSKNLNEFRISIQKITQIFCDDNDSENKYSDLKNKITSYVEEHIDQPITVSDVASALYMNPDYLSRQFKIYSGMSLKEYIVNRKMQSAQILLKTTALPVSVIASSVGYDNFPHFSQAYKKVMGLSPTEERTGHFVKKV